MSRAAYWSPLHVSDAVSQRRRQTLERRALGGALGFLVLITGLIAHATAPRAFSLAFVVLVFALVATAIRPVLGVHLIVFLSLIGDIQTTIWWPFTKNMSSRESIFFVSDALSITPLETLLGMTYVSVLVRVVSERTWRFRAGRLGWPMAAFASMIAWGFVHGHLTGHNRTVAILEARPLAYIVALYVLMTTLFTTRTQYRVAFGLALGAISIQSLFALNYWRSLSAAERAVSESLVEHTAAVGMNVVFIFLLGLIAFGGSRRARRWLFCCLPVVVYAYLLSQRRAAMVALFAGTFVLLSVLFYRNRRAFWRVTPVLTFFGLLFVAATWNATGGLGLASSAVKSVFFPGQLSEAEIRSNDYRDAENYNLWFTIRQSPLTGFGFGRRFIVVRPMADISFFEYWQYLPHNSVLWIWIKMGYLGFAITLFLFAYAVTLGARAVRRTRSADDAALVTAAVAYVVMFLIFAYVDIGWDIRPAVLLALSFAICADFESAAASGQRGTRDDTALPAGVTVGGRDTAETPWHEWPSLDGPGGRV